METTTDGAVLLLHLNDTTPPGDATSTAVLLPPGVSANVSFSWSSLCNTSEPQDMRENYPFPQLAHAARNLDVYEILQVVLMSVVFVVSVCGNVVVIVVVYFNNFLRSTVNYYLVNLAVADLLITVFCWPTIVNRITSPLYLLGRPLCRISVLTQGMCVTVSVLTLATVACDRVYAVLLPIQARSKSSRPLTLIVVLWVVSFAVAFPSFYVRDTRVFQWYDLREETCMDLLCSRTANVVFTYYRILLMATLFFVPGVVMLLAYSVIVFRLWCVKRPAVGAGGGGSRAGVTRTSSAPAPHTRAKRKIVKMTAMVLLAFTTCWSPLHGLVMYDLIVDYPLPLWFDRSLFWAYFLGYCNSALNPLLYGGFSDNFRLGFRNMCRSFRRSSDPSQHRSSRTTSTILSRMVATRRTSSLLSRGSTGTGPVSRQTSNSISPYQSARRKVLASHQASNSLSRQSSGDVTTSRKGSNPLAGIFVVGPSREKGGGGGEEEVVILIMRIPWVMEVLARVMRRH
ncbi:QRFP-like peptide receptor [Panulirus ornatus]|uniref:QRFP-like peptide receptor n=1 Tax=Panulirus ornatus TaxID=150431 RepID=UPI003A8744CC